MPLFDLMKNSNKNILCGLACGLAGALTIIAIALAANSCSKPVNTYTTSYTTPKRANSSDDFSGDVYTLVPDWETKAGYVKSMSFDTTLGEEAWLSGGTTAADNANYVIVPVEAGYQAGTDGTNGYVTGMTFAYYSVMNASPYTNQMILKDSPLGGFITFHPVNSTTYLYVVGIKPLGNELTGDYSALSWNDNLQSQVFGLNQEYLRGYWTTTNTDVPRYANLKLTSTFVRSVYYRPVAGLIAMSAKFGGEEYQAGRAYGYEQGYSAGVTFGRQTQGEGGEAFTNVFSLLALAFQPATTFFNMKVFGFLPLYWFFLIPIFAGIITLILRMIKH